MDKTAVLFVLLLAVFAANAQFRITDCGGDVWRLQTACADGSYDNDGAIQALNSFLGEEVREKSDVPSRGRIENDEGLPVIRFRSPDGRLLMEVDGFSQKDGIATISGKLDSAEGFFGGGCRLDRLDKRGTVFELDAVDGWNRSDTTYMPVPLFSTSRGGGFLVNSYSAMKVDAGKTDPNRWTVSLAAKNIDIYFFTGGSLRGVRMGYWRISGLTAAPRLSDGPVICRHYGARDFDTFEKIRKMYDSHVNAGIKPSAMIIEPWPIKESFADPAKERDLRAMGAFFAKEKVPLLIWMLCGDVLNEKAPGFKEEYCVTCDILTNGVAHTAASRVVPSVKGEIVNPDVGSESLSFRMLDITNPEAWCWYSDNILRFLVEHNIIGAKIDFCELFPDDGADYGGTSVRYHWKHPEVFANTSVHHAYPSFFNARFFREMKRISGDRSDAFVFCRGGGIGCQLAPYYWAGDQARTFPKLGDQLLAVLNSRLSGMPYMSYDMGGYSRGDGYAPEFDELVFARAIGFTKYMPLMQTHGSVKNFFDMSRKVQDIYAEAVRFHAEVAKNRKEVAPLVEFWPDDPKVWNIGDEFMYGTDLLVAPIVTEADWRDVYLPAGEWTDVRSGSRFSVGKHGLTIKACAGLGEVPTYRISPVAGPDSPSGVDSWAMRERHPAVVNAVCDQSSANLISLRGTWEFVMTDVFAQGRRNSHDEPFFTSRDEWRNPSAIQVPGCWEAQLPPKPGMGQSWDFKFDHGAKPIRNPTIGEGWYRKRVDIPVSWAGKRIWLKIGGVKSCGWFWVNGKQTAHVYNYCGTYKYDVTDCIVPGETSEIVAEVSNFVPSRKGQMSWLHRWGGIYRDIELEATPQTLIDDAWIRGDYDAGCAEAHVEIGGPIEDTVVRLTVDGRRSELPAHCGDCVIRLPLSDFRRWSPEHPNLYTGVVELVRNGQAFHARRERFAFRKLEVRGDAFYLNGNPFFIRGFGDDSVYPLTGISPADRLFHLHNLRRAHEAGFNFVRLHTHCELPEYFEAADEAGILVQAELPYINGDIPTESFPFDPIGDTLELYRNYRRHPSFAVYSGGNEGSFGPALDRHLYEMVKKMDPDRLKICQDTQMASFNTTSNSDFRGGPVTEWPRGSIRPGMPFVCHEYLNLCVKLDSRSDGDYRGAWMPPVTRTERLEWLKRFGLDADWGDRLQDSQHSLQKYWQKHGIEWARTDPYCDGFCFWTIVDVVVRQFETYTSQGLFDPFWRPKRAGATPREFAMYNSPVCLTLDVEGGKCVFLSGERMRCSFHLSNYGEEPIGGARLEWKIVGAGQILASGAFDVGEQGLGSSRPIGDVDVDIPAVRKPIKASMTVDLAGHSNAWDIWIFPKRVKRRISNVVAAAKLLPHLNKLYDGIGEVTDGFTGDVAIMCNGDPGISNALRRGKCVISIGPVGRSEEEKLGEWYFGERLPQPEVDKFRFGSYDARLGWWFMGHQVGMALRNDPCLGTLPHDGYISPLFFRIVGKGRKLPTDGLNPQDLVVVGEGGDAGYAFVSRRKVGDGVLMEIDGLDVLSGYPEGTSILDGLVDSALGGNK